MSVKSQANSQPIHEKRPTSLLSGLRVLLVEDEFDIADLFLFVLQEMGADVVLVFSAGEALQRLHQQQPDILISNVRLPDQDGTWLIRQVRSKGIDSQQLPAIAVSSYLREVNGERVLEAGFQRFLAKLIDPDELAVEVLSVMKRVE